MKEAPPEPVGTLAVALRHASKLLAANPVMAEEQCREILKVVPGDSDAISMLAAALRLQERAEQAVELLNSIAGSARNSASIQYELGLSLGATGRSSAAIEAFKKAIAANENHGGAWRALGDELGLIGDLEGADLAYARHIRASVNDPELLDAANALCANRLAVAERLLRAFLIRHPTDVAAIRMLAEVGARLGRLKDAEILLARCLELSPGFVAARHNYAVILHRQMKSEPALLQVDELLKIDPRSPGYRALKAAILGRIGEFEQAIDIYETLLKEFPDQPKAWMSYGHALKTVGRQRASIDAYRRSLQLRPSLGEAYWSLANLKTYRFSDEEVAAMRSELQRRDISDQDRIHLNFALGKALEDAGSFGDSFQHYKSGNALRRTQIEYDAGGNSEHVRRSIALFSAEFFEQRAGGGCPAPDPIFVVGLPRAGSTLLEQVLSSHSAIEGTMELPDIISIAGRLGDRKRKNELSAYPEVLGTLAPSDLKALGEEYLSRTRIQRKLGRPFFIDKMPNNFLHVGLIHLILPNARIVDARRHPLGCCFSAFKQHFARGQNFTYDLTELGRYYADYVALMAHFDRVLPGRVHRVTYERMVEDPEGEVRRLLDYCGVPFEAQCLHFHENERAVRTASSEQVRQPLFSDAVDHWRNFEPWLDELKAALGPIVQTYPAVADLA